MNLLPRGWKFPMLLGCVATAWLAWDLPDAAGAPGRAPPNYRPAMPPRPPPPAPIPPRPFDFDNGLKHAGSRFIGNSSSAAGQTGGTAGVAGQGGGGVGGQGGGGLGGLGGGGGAGGLGGGGFGGKQFGMDGGQPYYHQEPTFRHGFGIFGGVSAPHAPWSRQAELTVTDVAKLEPLPGKGQRLDLPSVKGVRKLDKPAVPSENE